MGQFGDVFSDKRSVEDKQRLENVVGVLDTLIVLFRDSLLGNLQHGNDQLLESLDLCLFIGGDVLGDLGKTSKSGHTDLTRFRVTQGGAKNVKDRAVLSIQRVKDSVEQGEQDVNRSLTMCPLGRTGSLVQTGK